MVGHWRSPGCQQRIGRGRAPRAAAPRRSACKVARFGDNMRYVAVTEGDKVEAQLRLGFTVNGYGVGDLIDAVAQVSDGDGGPSWSQRLRGHLRRRAGAAPGRRAARLAASSRPGSRPGCASFLEAGGFGAFTDNFEDLGRLRQLPGIAAQRLMADGYGFGAEGDWKSAALLRIVKVMTAGLPGGTSFMEDYTYDLDARRGLILGAHMLELCPSIAARAAALRDRAAVAGAARGPGPARLQRGRRARRRHQLAGPRQPVPPGAQRRSRSSIPPKTCPACRWPGPSGGRNQTWPPRRRPG